MTALLRAEARKLTSTRGSWFLVAGVLVLSGLAGLTGAQTAADYARPLSEQQSLLIAAFTTKLVFVVLGIRMFTDEFRHGTTVPTFLLSPRRGRVLLAKAGLAVLLGVVVGAAGQAVLFLSAAFRWDAAGHSFPLGPPAARAAAGAVVASAVWALLGLAIGAILRSPAVAVTAVLVWLMGLEEALHSQLGRAGDHLPGNAGHALALGLGRTVTWAALAACVAVALAAATLALGRRDV